MKMEEWKEYKLTEIMDLIGGGTPKTSNPDYWDGDIPWISVKDFNGERRYVGDTEKKITKLGLENSSTKILSKGDIIISARGTVGELAIIPSDMAFNQSCYGLRAKDFVDSCFLYYLLKQSVNILKHNTHGSVFDTITRETFENISVKLPPLLTQQKIADILSSLDDKIELNNKINTNLEQQAGALFKNWFVDFEPFGAEEKIESPIGTMIPSSLRMVQVADIPHLLETGKRPKGGAVAEGVPSIGAENVKQLGVFDFSSNKFIPQEYADSLGKGKINGYELLLYKDGGKPGTFIPHFSMFGEGFPYAECYINEHVFKLDFYDKGLNEFAYFYFNTEYVKNWLANNGGKAAIPGINQNDVNAIWIYDLENPKVKEFAKFVEPLFKQIFSNCKQNRELSTTRDTLLPKLMNGEILI